MKILTRPVLLYPWHRVAGLRRQLVSANSHPRVKGHEGERDTARGGSVNGNTLVWHTSIASSNLVGST